MSYSQSTRDQFLSLRADGLSYAQCAQQLNVSKHTLVNWAKEVKPQLDALRAIHTESLLDQYQLRLHQRIILLAGLYHRVAQTIEKTDLLTRSVGTLFTILLKLNTALDKYDLDPAAFLIDQEPQKTEPPQVSEPEPQNPQSQPLVNAEVTTPNLEPQKTEPKMNHPVSSPSSTEHFSVSSESDLLNYIDDYFGKYQTYPPEHEIKKLRQTLNRLDRHEAKINRQAS
jgi:hypothetical protein